MGCEDGKIWYRLHVTLYLQAIYEQALVLLGVSTHTQIVIVR